MEPTTTVLHIQMYALVAFAFLSWLVFMLCLCKLYKFFSEFELFKAKNDAEQNSIVCHLRKAEDTRLRMLSEMKRTNRLLNDIYKHRIGQSDTEIEYVDEDIMRLERKSEVAVEPVAEPVNNPTNETQEIPKNFHPGPPLKNCFDN